MLEKDLIDRIREGGQKVPVYTLDTMIARSHALFDDGNIGGA
jgi:hypothetical protein